MAEDKKVDVPTILELRALRERSMNARAVADSAGGGVEGWQSLLPYLGTSFTTYGTVDEWWHARFYKDRGRVWLAGQVEATHDGAQTITSSLDFPEGYRPDNLSKVMIPTDPDGGTVQGDWWPLQIRDQGTNGEFALKVNPRFGGSPNFGYAPQWTAFSLDGISYRAI